jgi:hypothetical protein
MNSLYQSALWSKSPYSAVFSAPIGQKIAALYINESDAPNYPKRKNTVICRDLILKRVVNGVFDGEEYKIAFFEVYATKDCVEFLQFRYGNGSIVGIDEYNYVFADCLYNAAPLEYTIFRNHDPEYNKKINALISADIEFPICVYSGLNNVKWSEIEVETQKEKENEWNEV